MGQYAETQWGFPVPIYHTADIYRPVKWAQEGICYQIFPQSFCNGNKLNDPEGVSPWGAEPAYRTFYGGDLQGIIDRLPYLSELGVTFLYLTPIFLSTSPHKYNTDDYYKIDPHFGDAETLAKLLQNLFQCAIIWVSGLYLTPCSIMRRKLLCFSGCC